MAEFDWETMCQHVVIDGRPGDVESAALGWEQLLRNLRSVKESLETNVKDLGTVWKGPAYDSFKTHIEQLAKDAEQLAAKAEEGNGIAGSLRDAAGRLTDAQRDFPIPAHCVNDVAEARNANLTLGVGFFKAKVEPDFLGLYDPLTSLYDWLNDKTEDAARVYNTVNDQYQTIAPGVPEGTPGNTGRTPEVETPNLGGGPGTGGAGGVPSVGGMPGTGGIGGGGPSTGKLPGMDSGSPNIGSSAHPDLSSSGGYTPSTSTLPSTGTGGGDYGTGLAGAGTATTPGLGSGGGLPGTTGLGGSGGGLGGGGGISGGGALGRPVGTGLPPMMGGAAGAGAGRGAGGRGAGRGAGKLGAGGGMAPGMGGAAGAAGRNAGRGGAARGGVAGAGGRGAGARGGMAGLGHGGGAGYGDEETPRNTWLEEDEDVWGADEGGTPGILR